jgi:putative polyhydroxyalkanoate system protein
MEVSLFFCLNVALFIEHAIATLVDTGAYYKEEESMAGFTIQRQFSSDSQQIQSTAHQLADKLVSEHPVKAEWRSDNECILSGMGVDGRVHIGEDTLTIEVKLGLLTRMFEDRMKREIEHYLDKYLS